MFFKRLKTRLIIADQQFNIIRDNVKLKSIPREGEFIFFDKESQYYTVFKVIHNISDNNTTWIIIIPLEHNQIS